MAEPINPLFEDEKEFLERQKLEYERALMGEVEEIKEKTQQVGKYAAIGAGVLGGIWLLSKAFKGKKNKSKHNGELGHDSRARRTLRALRKDQPSDVDFAVNDGFNTGSHQADRGFQSFSADAGPDPFRPYGYSSSRSLPAVQYSAQQYASDHSDGSSSIVAETFRAFMQSDTGKLLVAQATAVLMAVVAKKVGDYLPMFKNPDLAPSPSQEPETRDIDFTFHDDDANTPHQSL